MVACESDPKVSMSAAIPPYIESNKIKAQKKVKKTQ
jgi:hypothetical protein